MHPDGENPDRETTPILCDCHVHVFEAPETYPFENVPAYEPPFSPVATLGHVAQDAGINRFVLVQPTPYGRDLSLLRDSLLTLGTRARGVGVADASTGIDDLAKLKDAGICALRFVENRLADGSRMPGTVPVDILLQDLAPKLLELGMHAEIWAPLPTILSEWPQLEKTGVPIVLDHMGSFETALGVNHRDFQCLLRLVRDGLVWIKLAVCRRAPGDPQFQSVRPFHDALIEAGDNQLLWATDFPFVRYPGEPPRTGQLLGLFRNWVNDPTIEHRILAQNPAERYWPSRES